MRASYIASTFMAALVAANEYHGEGITLTDRDGNEMLSVNDLDYEFYSADKWIYLTQHTSASSTVSLDGPATQMVVESIR